MPIDQLGFLRREATALSQKQIVSARELVATRLQLVARFATDGKIGWSVHLL